MEKIVYKLIMQNNSFLGFFHVSSSFELDNSSLLVDSDWCLWNRIFADESFLFERKDVQEEIQSSRYRVLDPGLQ